MRKVAIKNCYNNTEISPILWESQRKKYKTLPIEKYLPSNRFTVSKMAINLTKKCNKVHHPSLRAYLLEGKIKKYFYKEIIKKKFWSLRTDGKVEKKMLEKRLSLGGLL